jgi:phosphoglycolate phosphatase
VEAGVSGVVFDLDGTLIDSAPDIHLAANEVLRAEGLGELDLPTVRSFIGNGVAVLISRCIEAVGAEETPQLHAHLSREFLRIYEGEPRLTRLYPGAEEAIRTLKGQGYRVGLCTNKPEAATAAVLEHFGVIDLFDALVCGDTLPARKPDPAPLRHAIEELSVRRVAYVGDSEVDAETAERAKVAFALYTGGYRKAPVEALYHDARFDHFDELPPIVNRLAPPPE